MPKKEKPWILYEAKFDLTPAESETLTKMLAETNRDLNNFVETILKKAVAAHNANSLILYLNDVGLHYRQNKPKQKPHEKL